MTVRSRDLDYKVSFPPASISGTPFGGGTLSWKGRQFTVSQGNRKNPRTGKYDTGGEFFTYRTEADIKTADVNWRNASGTRSYAGPICVSLVPSNYGDFAKAPSSDSSYLDSVGAEAISIVDPTNPNAQTGVALGEILRDRRLPIPAIQAWKRRTEIAKAASGEYLNAVFGWLPLVSDMKDTAQSILDGNTILENYSNASGTWVHREFEFAPLESVKEFIAGNTIPTYAGGASLGNEFNNGVKPVTCVRVSKTRRWFSGAFTYHAASANDSLQSCLGLNTSAEKLFGVSLTPDLVWELVPWSWAIDWFSNAQSIVHNISSFELAGLVMPYAYIMEETSIVDTYTMPPDTVRNRTVHLPPCTFTHTVKRRREANPFGFGLRWDGLSPTQLAITAALGITHLR